MTREEAIRQIRDVIAENNSIKPHIVTFEQEKEALYMAIEALQFAEHFDLLKEYQSLQEVVRCKDCIHQEHCYKTVAHTRHHDDFIEHWSETIEWCSRGERKGGDDECV